MSDREAGQELDAEVAEKVMGLCVHEWTFRTVDEWTDDWEATCERCGAQKAGASCDIGPVSGRVERYSTDFAAAWQVVEKLAPLVGDFMAADGAFYLVYSEDYSGDPDCGPEGDGPWTVHMHLGAVGSEGGCLKHWDHGDRFCVTAATAPLAICLAALKAIEAAPDPTEQEAFTRTETS